MTHAELLAALYYDPGLGWFMWLTDRGKKIKAGGVAGWIANGYVRLSINYRTYQANQVAHFYMTGSWPEHEIDHRNRNTTDNRWWNLRPATHKQNLENRALQPNSTSGANGVSWDKARKLWAAHIKHHGVKMFLGRFPTKLQAIDARLTAEKKYFTHSGGASC